MIEKYPGGVVDFGRQRARVGDLFADEKLDNRFKLTYEAAYKSNNTYSDGNSPNSFVARSAGTIDPLPMVDFAKVSSRNSCMNTSYVTAN